MYFELENCEDQQKQEKKNYLSFVQSDIVLNPENLKIDMKTFCFVAF